MVDGDSTGGSPRQGWQIQARARMNWLRQEVREAARRDNGEITEDNTFKRIKGPRGDYEEAYAEILQRLATAESYLMQKPDPKGWVRGTRIEGVWTNIHAAHARLFEVASDEQVLALVPDVQTAVAAYLPPGHPWKKQLDVWIRRPKSSGNAAALNNQDREFLSNAMHQAYAANAERYTQLRRFRNILMGAALLFAFIALTLSAITAMKPQLLPLCFTTSAGEDASGESGAAGDGASTVCPSGGKAPGGADVALVAALGLLGGAIGSIPSLTHSTRATVMTYTLRVARMMLKVALGAVAAVVGIMFLQGGFVPGFGELDSQIQILVYAVIFGSSQQLITRLTDQQAEKVLKSASGEEESRDEAPA